MKYTIISYLSILIMIGCSNNPGIDVNDNNYHTLRIPRSMDQVYISDNPDVNDPVQMLAFVNKLSKSGAHSKSAMIYEEIAGMESKDNEWKISCLTASAVEYLKAGDKTKFRSTVRKIKSTQNRFQKIVPNTLTETIFQIDKLMASSEVNSNEIDQKYWVLISK